MSRVQSGDIVLVSFPFTDLTGSKLRPAVVISQGIVHDQEDDYTLAFISSVIPPRIAPYELLIEKRHPDFKESGLKKDSLFKGNKIVTIQKKLLKRRLGRLGPKLLIEVQEVLRRALFV